MQNTNNAAVNALRSDRERSKLGMDNVSEESILPLQGYGQEEKARGIMKTTSVFVKAHRSDDFNPQRNVEDRV